MDGKHLTGGSLAAVVAYVASKFGWSVSTDEALQIGAAFALVGGAMVHLFSAPGLIPRVKSALGVGKPAA